jgi:hypothetical protein
MSSIRRRNRRAFTGSWCLGDSYAEAQQVPIDQTFWKVMERELATCPRLGGKGVEVINLGIDGWGTAQEVLMLRERGWAFAPDLVVLAVTTGNDIRNNSKALEPDKVRPFFFVRNGELVVEYSFRNTLRYRLRSSPLLLKIIDWSRTVQLSLYAIRQRDEAWKGLRSVLWPHEHSGTAGFID